MDCLGRWNRKKIPSHMHHSPDACLVQRPRTTEYPFISNLHHQFGPPLRYHRAYVFSNTHEGPVPIKDIDR